MNVCVCVVIDVILMCPSVRQPVVSSCDVLVVPVGHSSMSRAIKVTQKLWTAGVSSDIVYDVSQVCFLLLLKR